MICTGGQLQQVDSRLDGTVVFTSVNGTCLTRLPPGLSTEGARHAEEGLGC